MLIEISLVAFFYIPNLCSLCEERCYLVGDRATRLGSGPFSRLERRVGNSNAYSPPGHYLQ